MLGKEASESPRTSSLSRCFSAPVTVSLLVKVGSTPPPAGPEHPQREMFLNTQGTCSLCLLHSNRRKCVSGSGALLQSQLVLEWVNWHSDGFFRDNSTPYTELNLFSLRTCRFFRKVNSHKEALTCDSHEPLSHSAEVQPKHGEGLEARQQWEWH